MEAAFWSVEQTTVARVVCFFVPSAALAVRHELGRQ